MKKTYLLIALLLVLPISCVQKTYTKTVVYLLSTSGKTAINQVSIRGVNLPLSWQSDTEMEVVKKDSLYKKVVTYVTGYAFTEVKFIVNGEWELAEKPNRRVVFTKGDTTFYNATYNQAH